MVRVRDKGGSTTTRKSPDHTYNKTHPPKRTYLCSFLSIAARSMRTASLMASTLSAWIGRGAWKPAASGIVSCCVRVCWDRVVELLHRVDERPYGTAVFEPSSVPSPSTQLPYLEEPSVPEHRRHGPLQRLEHARRCVRGVHTRADGRGGSVDVSRKSKQACRLSTPPTRDVYRTPQNSMRTGAHTRMVGALTVLDGASVLHDFRVVRERQHQQLPLALGPAQR